MRGLKSLTTPPTSQSVPLSDDSSSVLTDVLSFGIPDSDGFSTADTEELSACTKPLPQIPRNEPPKPVVERRNTTTSLRPADDLLTQVDVLRDCANIARSRRPRFRHGDKVAYDRTSDVSRQRASTLLSVGPEPSREPTVVQTTIREASRIESDCASWVGPTLNEWGADNAQRSTRRFSTSTGIRSINPTNEQPTPKMGTIFRGPASFFRRFLCLGLSDAHGQTCLAELHTSGSRVESCICPRCDTFFPPETRRIRPRFTMLSPRIIDIR